jgi:hypothetical protein
MIIFKRKKDLSKMKMMGHFKQTHCSMHAIYLPMLWKRTMQAMQVMEKMPMVIPCGQRL